MLNLINKLPTNDHRSLSTFWQFCRQYQEIPLKMYKVEVHITYLLKFILLKIPSCCSAQLTWSCCFPSPPTHSISFLPCCQLIGCRLVAESHGAVRATALSPSASSAQGGLQLGYCAFSLPHSNWNVKSEAAQDKSAVFTWHHSSFYTEVGKLVQLIVSLQQ